MDQHDYFDSYQNKKNADDLTIKDIVVALQPKAWEKTYEDCKNIAKWYYSLLEWKCNPNNKLRAKRVCGGRQGTLQQTQAAIFENRRMVIYPKAIPCHTTSRPTCI